MSNTAYNIALIQMRCSNQARENLDKAITMLKEASQKGAKVACLPELFMSQYFCQQHDSDLFELAEPIPGPTTKTLGQVAKETRMTIVVPLFEKRVAGVYHNTVALLTADGNLGGIYRKMHIPHDPLFYEKYYFTPGDTGFTHFDIPQGRIATLICWDQWFPEAARLSALQGAEVLFYPTAIGWHPSEKAVYGEKQRDAWETIQRSHAIANGIYVASVNRVGHEQLAGEGIEFWGGSFIADPFGEIIAKADAQSETIVMATVEPKLIEETRRNWPFLRDRRIDYYANLLTHPQGNN
ncbi:MAG: carbon-nitrogen hydrolase [Pseudomonadota bacterium]